MTDPQNRHATLDEVDDFVARTVRARGIEMDRTGRFDRELLQEAASLGLTSLFWDQELELDLSTMRHAHETTERIAAVCTPLAMEIGVTRLVAYLLSRYAGDPTRSRWLAATLSGRAHGSFALTEPAAGTDLRAMRTVATRHGDHYVLNGSKCWVGFAPVADYAIVLCKAETDARDASTLALVVDMETDGASGSWGPALSGFRGLPNGVLEFEDVHVPAEEALEVEGFGGMMDGLNLARIDAAAYACGLLRAALEHSSAHASTRIAFERPIAELPSIQRKIGRMHVDYLAAREMTLRAADSFVERQGGDRSLISAAKLFASDAAREHTDHAMQVLGASGLVLNTDVERLHRDAKATQIFDGTSEIHEVMLGRSAIKQWA